MSCLNIGFPHLRPIIRIADVADPNINNKCGMASGYRHNLIYSEDDLSLWFMDFDYGSIFAPDYLYIAKLALTPGVDSLSIETSPDNVTFTEVWDTTSITYQGNNDQDYFINFGPIGPARFWRISLTTSTATKIRLSKIYLGNLFTFEKTPSVKTKQRLETRDKNTFYSTSGRVYKARSTKRVGAWDIIINNISDSNLAEFVKQTLDIEKRYVVLYDSSANIVFNNQAVWHGIISNVRFDKIGSNLNRVYFTFKEMP